MYTCNVFIDCFLLLFGYLLLFYALMRTERKSNSNIFENSSSNCLDNLYTSVSTILENQYLTFIEKLASYNFCKNECDM